MIIPLRAVYDCNVFLQALISPTGPAGKCVAAALRGDVTVFWSEYVIDELLELATDPKLRSKFGLTDQRMASYVENIEKAAVFCSDVPRQFELERDPDDAHYVDLAVQTKTDFLVTRDNDLLDLMDTSTPDGRAFHERFPSLRIVSPNVFADNIHLTKDQNT